MAINGPWRRAERFVGDENYIRESIIYPKAKVVAGYQPVMPSYKGQLSDDDIDSIVEYLKTISDYTPTAPRPQKLRAPKLRHLNRQSADGLPPSEE